MIGFKKRHDDGRVFPTGNKKTVVEMSTVRSGGRNFNRLVASKAGKKNLENEMIFKNFVKHLEKLNPNKDIDAEIIDRTLEWEEALNDIKGKHPHIITEEVKETHMTEFREDLDRRGIGNETVQNLIAQADKPLSEKEIEEVAGALNTRPEHALKIDKSMKAELTKDVRKWAKHPNELDIKTVDEKEVKIQKK
jgi:hypothetical protein